MSLSRHLLASTSFLFAASLFAGAPARAGGQLLEVPVRWCGVKGSPTVDTNGAAVGEPDLDNALWRRHERASDRVWLAQGTSITFRSAITADNLNDKDVNFPMIDDPSTSPGSQPGDILDPNLGNTSEFDLAVIECGKKWDLIAGKSSVVGPIALNVRKLVKADGSENLQGYARYAYMATGASTFLSSVCQNPGANVTSLTGALAVADYSFIRSFDPDEQILAHEFGHVLTLEHGNGRDDDGDTIFDGDPNYSPQCDPGESNPAPHSLMNPIATTAKTITSGQRTRARAFARVNPNVQVDPPLALVPADTTGDDHVDSIHEVSDPSIDITTVEFTTHAPSQTTTITHSLLDELPEVPSHQYLAFVDLDGDTSTGGEPADLDLGVPTGFVGAELVTRVIVVDADGIAVVPTLWKFQAGVFVEVTDPSIQASLGLIVGGEIPKTEGNTISITFSNAVRGAIASSIRLQAFAQTPLPEPPGPTLTGAVLANGAPEHDVAPGGIAFAMFLDPAKFPAAGVTPPTARPRQAVTVEALDLLPNAMAKVFFGDLMVGGGTTDGSGAFKFTFVVPANSALGERLVTVGNVGTALTGDTSLVVTGDPLPDTPVAIDVKPGSCPNPIRAKETGKIAVAILGSATLDVSQLDPSLVRFAGIAPLSTRIEDVATPFLPITGRRSAKDCTTLGPDGYPDLLLHFDAQTLRAALGPITNKQVRVLTLTGNLLPEFGGAPIVGEDVVVTLTK